MECGITKPTKPSSNESEMVTKFAKVCKLRSIGVFSSENPSENHYPDNNRNGHFYGEEGNIDSEEMECDVKKIHPECVVVPGKSNLFSNEDVVELFDIVSALKLAYVRLQEAHVPYDPDKIIAADELVVAKLGELCRIKQMCKAKQFAKAKHDSSQLDCLRAEIEANEGKLEKLKSQNRAKGAEIVRLQQQLHDVDLGNAMLVEKRSQKSSDRKNRMVLNIPMFEETFKSATKSIHDFAKPLISLLKAAGWDLDLAANSIENGVVYSKRSDKKYSFEAYIARRMFYGISLKSYNVDDIMRLDDPIDYLIENPNSEFANFCRKKYLFIVHPMMEMSFFGNLDHRMLALGGKHPRTPFYQIFARMAKWVWVLQGIASSIDSNAEIFSVKRGSKFSVVYMESVEQNGKGSVVYDAEQFNQMVEFMVMPGFRIGETVMRSRVYLSEARP